MLNKAWGGDAQGDLLGRLEAAMNRSEVEALQRLERGVRYQTTKNEHPQIHASR